MRSDIVTPMLTVIGSINEDVTLQVESLPNPGETVLARSLRRSPGGKGANQASAAARLGGDVRLVGAVGEDPAGERLMAGLSNAGVDTSGVARVNCPTGQAQIVVDAGGENTIVVVPGANDRVQTPQVLTHAVLCQLEIPLDVVLSAANASSGYFALNASPARRLPARLVERCDLVVVNEHEYEAMPELQEARLVVVTLGADGAMAVSEGIVTVRVPGRPSASVVSTVGAGDAFCAAITLALSAKVPLALALEAACAVGAVAVECAEAQPQLGSLSSYLAT